MLGGREGLIRLGDAVEGGGKMLQASGAGCFTVGGLPVVLEGDLGWCDTHQGEFPIGDGDPIRSLNGRRLVFDRARLACGCCVLSSVNYQWGREPGVSRRHADALTRGFAPTRTSSAEPARFTDQTNSSLTAVTLRIGLFTDGTGNNMGNTAYGLACLVRDPETEAALRCDPRLLDKLSYKNDVTNVARLYELYQRTPSLADAEDDGHGGKVVCLKAYATGPGTRTGERGDSSIGLGTGTGSTGVFAKVQEALGELEGVIRRFREENAIEIARVEFDIFGLAAVPPWRGIWLTSSGVRA